MGGWDPPPSGCFFKLQMRNEGNNFFILCPHIACIFSWTQCFLSCPPRCLGNELQNSFVIIYQEFWGSFGKGLGPALWDPPAVSSPPFLRVSSLLAGWNRGPRALSPIAAVPTQAWSGRMKGSTLAEASSKLQWGRGGGGGRGQRAPGCCKPYVRTARASTVTQKPAYQLSVHLPTGHHQGSKQTSASSSPRKDCPRGPTIPVGPRYFFPSVVTTRVYSLGSGGSVSGGGGGETPKAPG